jgi:hypothetical protein
MSVNTVPTYKAVKLYADGKGWIETVAIQEVLDRHTKQGYILNCMTYNNPQLLVLIFEKYE